MVWKDARRRFYWRVRARLAYSAALQKLAEASPISSHEYRTRLLDQLSQLDGHADSRAQAEALEKLDLSATLSQLKADTVTKKLLEVGRDDRKAMVAGLAKMMDDLTADEKEALRSVLASQGRSPGKFL
jgi:acetyl-CoA carboxylase / biotin carboxylase 1